MSRRSNNFRGDYGYGYYATNNNDSESWSIFPPSAPVQATPDGSRGAQDPWSFEERVRMTRPFGSSSFREQPRTPVRVLVLINDMAREANSSPRQFIPVSPPRVTRQRNTQEEDSRLTKDEQQKALKKLKKEIYNPVPMSIGRRLNLYYSNQARNSVNEKLKERDEDGKRCAVCLDDFEPKEGVVVTPCNHMFHEDCIVPWVKSHGQCPVCRFALCKRVRETATPLNYYNFANRPANDLFAGDIASIIREMEEAFQWSRALR